MKEYRICSSLGIWPEKFNDDQLYYVKSDLEYNKDQYPNITFWVEEREVGPWTRVGDEVFDDNFTGSR